MKKTGIIAAVLVFGICVCGMDQGINGVMSTATTDTNTTSANATGTNATNRRALTDQEIEELTGRVKMVTMDFFQSSYYDVRYANYDCVFYTGADIHDRSAFTQEEDEYTGAGHEIRFDIICIPGDKLESFLQEKTGLEVDNIYMSGYYYSENHDVFIKQVSDTNYQPYTCIGGVTYTDTKNDCQIYIFALENDIRVTLRKIGDTYQIVSCIRSCDRYISAEEFYKAFLSNRISAYYSDDMEERLEPGSYHEEYVAPDETAGDDGQQEIEYIDVDGDGEMELFIYDIYYGGELINRVGEHLEVVAKGYDTSGYFSLVYSDDSYWVVYSDTTHSGRQYYEFNRLGKECTYAETIVLYAEYTSAITDADAEITLNDEMITYDRYQEILDRFYD